MEKPPLVSICIPTYNRADMVGKAIESALRQSYSHIEVIVVDNASTDHTDEIISQFKDVRLKYIKNSENLGLFGNFNRCIELASGEFIHILHSDDFIDPEFTGICVNFFKAHPNVWLTFTSAQYISGAVKETISYSDKDEIFIAPDGFNRILTERHFIICPTVMVRKELFSMVGNFSLEYPYSADYYQWLKITRSYDIAFIKSAFLYYVQGEHSETYRLLFSNPSGYLDTLKIYVKIIHDLDKDQDQFRSPLNSSIQRFIGDCLYAGLTRVDMMKNFNSSIFTGIAISAWSLLKPGTIMELLKKIIILPIILAAGFLISIPFLRTIIKAMINENKKIY